jgi:hypothetical protein
MHVSVQPFAGLSLSKALDWVKRHRREVIGGAVVLGGAALAAKTAGGWSALGTKAGWTKVGTALVGSGSKAVAAVRQVDLGKAVASTATVLTTAAAFKDASGPDTGAFVPPNLVDGGGATVEVSDTAPEGGLPGWVPWALGGVAVLGLLWALSGRGARRVAVAA